MSIVLYLAFQVSAAFKRGDQGDRQNREASRPDRTSVVVWCLVSVAGVICVMLFLAFFLSFGGASLFGGNILCNTSICACKLRHSCMLTQRAGFLRPKDTISPFLTQKEADDLISAFVGHERKTGRLVRIVFSVAATILSTSTPTESSLMG